MRNKQEAGSELLLLVSLLGCRLPCLLTWLLAFCLWCGTLSLYATIININRVNGAPDAKGGANGNLQTTRSTDCGACVLVCLSVLTSVGCNGNSSTCRKGGEEAGN